MAMDTTRLRDNLFSRLFPGVTLTPADEVKVKASLLIWAEEIVAEIERADIVLDAGDITVDGNGLSTDEMTSVPVVGTASIDAATLTGKIE